MNLQSLPSFGALIADQGGILAAIIRAPRIDGAEQPPIALIVADASHEIEGEWGEYGKDVPGAASRTDGLANTLAMAEAGSELAQKLMATTIEGHVDWYLPSIGELNSAAANVPKAFSETYYWSSSQGSRHYAVCQDFQSGLSDWGGKGCEFRARPFRRVHLEALTA